MIENIDNVTEGFGYKLAEVAPRLKGNLVLVAACYKKRETDFLQHFHGLDIALERARKGDTVLVWSPLTTEYMLMMEADGKAKNFSTLVAMPNADYIACPFSLDAFVEKANELIDGKKQGNSAVVASGTAREREQKIAVLRHSSVDHGRYPSDPIAFLEDAAKLGFFGTVDDVREALRAWSRTLEGAYAGQEFPGLFIDVQGTLLLGENTLNGEVMEMARDAEQSGPVTVWTDGDLSTITSQLRKLGITWPIVSKFEFKGATVEKAIDDKSQDEFVELYGITATSFLQVK